MGETMQDWRTLPAGNEMDAAVHRVVFGRPVPTPEEMRAEAERVWQEQPACESFFGLGGFTYWGGAERGKPLFIANVPKYSRSIDAAWRVVAALIGRGLTIDLVERYRTAAWAVRFYPHGGPALPMCEADTAPLAICRAALAAVEASHA